MLFLSRQIGETAAVLTYYLKVALLEQVVEQTFLGVWFTKDFSWDTHINKLKAELSRVGGSIYKIQNLLPIWLKQTL